MFMRNLYFNEGSGEPKEGILKNREKQSSEKCYPKWIRSKDVRTMLGISDSTLQTLRLNGEIPCYKLGSTWFYKLEEINTIIENNKFKIGGKYVE